MLGFFKRFPKNKSTLSFFRKPSLFLPLYSIYAVVFWCHWPEKGLLHRMQSCVHNLIFNLSSSNHVQKYHHDLNQYVALESFLLFRMERKTCPTYCQCESNLHYCESDKNGNFSLVFTRFFIQRRRTHFQLGRLSQSRPNHHRCSNGKNSLK